MVCANSRRLLLASAVCFALSSYAWAGAPGASGAAPTSAAAPQDSTDAPAASTSNLRSQPSTIALQQIVTTASAIPVKKLDAGYNINTADREQIRELAPINVGDLIRAIQPGTWSEPTGGKSAGATEPLGYPSVSGAPFSTVLLNGTPFYGNMQISYSDSSTFMRLDDTISGVEAVQGGTAAILGVGQIGSTVNFKLRTGSDTPHGDMGLTYGSEGKERLDGFYGFPIGDNWYGSVGGFYRVSSGVRNTQYRSDEGGQVTATLKHVGDDSTLLLWTRLLDDKNLFLKQIPIIQTAPGGSFGTYPGFNPLTSLYNSRAIQYTQVPSAYGGMQSSDLADGRGANMRWVGGSFDKSWGSWTLSDHAVYGNGSTPVAALFPGTNPMPLSVFVYGCSYDQPAGFCNGTKPISSKNILNYPASRAVQATLPNGQVVPLSQSVIEQGLTIDHKHLMSAVNDFRISDEIFSGNTLTAGLYAARVTMENNNSSGNQMLLLNEPNTQPIALSYVSGGDIFTQANAQGLVNANSAKVFLENGQATNKAIYLTDTWVLGPWTLVAGGRIENENMDTQQCNTSATDIDGNPNTLYDNKTKICNGTWDTLHYNQSHPSWAASVNYAFNSEQSVYVNYSTAGHFNDFGTSVEPMLTMKDAEAGYRFADGTWSVDVNIYNRQFDGIEYQETDQFGTPIPGAISTYGSHSRGLNLILGWTPIENLTLSLTTGYVNGHYTDANSCKPGFDINGQPECLSFDGKELARQPNLQYVFTPKYTWPATWGGITAWASYYYVGQRYSDQTELQPLGTYHTISAGIVADVGQNWQFRLQGTNLTNEFGITEGNTGVLGTSVGANGVIMARPLFGREVFVQARYMF